MVSIFRALRRALAPEEEHIHPSSPLPLSIRCIDLIEAVHPHPAPADRRDGSFCRGLDKGTISYYTVPYPLSMDPYYLNHGRSHIPISRSGKAPFWRY